MAKGKQDDKKKVDPKKKVSLLAKAKNQSGGKAKKKKWSKGKVKEKLNNAVFFDPESYNKLIKEIPKNKLITPSVISEKLKVKVSLAKKAIKELEDKSLIRPVGDKNHDQMIYTRQVAA